jgi:hypothetical protein
MKNMALLVVLAGMLLPGTGLAQQEDGPDDVGRMFGPGNGVRGTVTATAADSFSIRTDEGDSYKVFFSVNTRLMKDREPMEASDVHLGDMLLAAGLVDSKAKTVGAVFVYDIDAKEVRDARAGFGKTWIMGKVTAIQELRITIERAGDKQAAVVAVDENTSFRKRKEDVTLADVKVGDFISAEGGLQGGSFLATTLRIMPPRSQPASPAHP